MCSHSTMFLSPPIEKLGSIPVSRRTPEDREKDIDDIVRWLRNGKDDSDDPTGEFEKIDQMVPVSQDRSRRITPVTLKVHSIGDRKCPGLGP